MQQRHHAHRKGSRPRFCCRIELVCHLLYRHGGFERYSCQTPKPHLSLKKRLAAGHLLVLQAFKSECMLFKRTPSLRIIFRSQQCLSLYCTWVSCGILPIFIFHSFLSAVQFILLTTPVFRKGIIEAFLTFLRGAIALMLSIVIAPVSVIEGLLRAMYVIVDNALCCAVAVAVLCFGCGCGCGCAVLCCAVLCCAVAVLCCAVLCCAQFLVEE